MKKIIISFLILFSILVTYKSYVAYKTFSTNNVPVYDGVMNEKNQIASYLRFKGNFSLIERFNQTIYEFKGNHLSAGFSCLITAINPNWLINDGDILLRSFLSVLIFSIVLFSYLKDRTSSTNSLIIITLIFQLPLFYHYRYGLTTYIPEIPSALFLLSGYLLILTFFTSEKINQLIIGLFLIIFSIMFRLNFFVYAFFFILPILYKSLSILRKKTKIEIIQFLIFLFTLISFISFYVIYNLEFFLSYYSGAKIPYVIPTLNGSLYTLLFDLKNEIGFLGVITLFFILLISNLKATSSKFGTVFLSYPFIFFFTFIFMYLKSLNNPHIVSALVVFMTSFFLIPVRYIQKLTYSIQPVYLKLTALLLIICLNIDYGYSIQAFSKTLPEQLAHKKVVDYIISNKNLDSNYKYICMYDEAVEIQIDVAIFNKTKVWLNSEDHFYLHDTYYLGMSPTLNLQECENHYTKKISSKVYDVIFINDSENSPIKGFKNATIINKYLLNYLKRTELYHLEKTLKSKYHGNILVFKK